MTMTRNTSRSGFQPSHITVAMAQSRLGEIKGLANDGDAEEAQIERAQLYVDVLYSIAYASGLADKSEMRKLAAVALEAFEIPITRPS